MLLEIIALGAQQPDLVLQVSVFVAHWVRRRPPAVAVRMALRMSRSVSGRGGSRLRTSLWLLLCLRLLPGHESRSVPRARWPFGLRVLILKIGVHPVQALRAHRSAGVQPRVH